MVGGLGPIGTALVVLGIALALVLVVVAGFAFVAACVGWMIVRGCRVVWGAVRG